MASDAAVLEGIGTETTSTSSADSLPATPQVEGIETSDFDYDDPSLSGDDEPNAESQAAEEPSESTESAEAVAEESSEGGFEKTVESTEFDDAILADAVRYGWDADKLKSFGTPEAARVMMAELDRQAAAWGKSQFEQPSGHQDAGQSDQQGTQQTQQQAQQQAADLLKKFEIPGDPSDWDDNAYKALTGINEHFHSTLTQQHQQVEQMRDAVLMMHEQFQSITRQQELAEAERVTREADTYFNSLPPELQETYGKGSINSLDPNSPQFKARQDFWVDAMGLMYADKVARRTQQPLPDVLGRVFNTRHSDLIKQSTRKEIAAKLEQRNKQSLDRPTGAQTRPKTPEEAALAFIKSSLPNLRS